jgi:hypothetical protein
MIGMAKEEIKIGDRFGRWTVIGLEETIQYGRPQHACRCECQAERPVLRQSLLSGASESCGCLRLERFAEAITSHGHTSGGKASPEYKAWCHLKERCLNPTHAHYHNYGGRGITVCDEWRDSFEVFHRDMGPRPTARHTIERKDNDAGYCKANCVWATRQEQAENRRSNNYLEHDGRRRTITEWSRVVGIPEPTISLRLKRGWSVADALTRPPVDTRGELVEHDGKRLTIAEWSRETGIAARLIGQRLGNGWPPARALATPPQTEPKVERCTPPSTS